MNTNHVLIKATLSHNLRFGGQRVQKCTSLLSVAISIGLSHRTLLKKKLLHILLLSGVVFLMVTCTGINSFDTKGKKEGKKKKHKQHYFLLHKLCLVPRPTANSPHEVQPHHSNYISSWKSRMFRGWGMREALQQGHPPLKSLESCLILLIQTRKSKKNG